MKANVDRYEFARVQVEPGVKPLRTHGGAVGSYAASTEQQLYKQVVTCLLWEDTFYAKGAEIASDIAELVAFADPKRVADIAIQARNDFHLRHVPLFLLALLDKRRKEAPGLLKATIPQVVQRADELAEFLAIHSRLYGYSMKELKKHLGAQVKRGLAAAFPKFGFYGLAKYNRDQAITLRDVLFLVHGKPKDAEQQKIWEKLVNDELESPDTWEVELSAGKDKRATFERLLTEHKLGGMALLRNLRLMQSVNVDDKLVKNALEHMKFGRVLPFRFLSAADEAPFYTNDLSAAMVRTLGDMPKLPGRTLIVADLSGSMQAVISPKSAVSRIYGITALMMIAVELCEEVVIYGTAGSDAMKQHKTRRLDTQGGFALREEIRQMKAQLGGGGIFLVQAMKFIHDDLKDSKFDRVLVFTDEQDCDIGGMKAAAKNAMLLGQYNYIMNVAPYAVGFDTEDRWVRISGFSERVFDFVRLNETPDAKQLEGVKSKNYAGV